MQLLTLCTAAENSQCLNRGITMTLPNQEPQFDFFAAIIYMIWRQAHTFYKEALI